MRRRFEGADGVPRRIDVIVRGVLAAGDPGIARALAECARVESYPAGGVLMAQGGHDTDVAVILAGSVEVLLNGHRVAVRERASTVGEMSAIDPSRPRAANVRALEDAVVGWISEPDLTRIAEAHPLLWRRLAQELADRLRQRSRFHAPPNERPRVFIGSSTEHLPVARAAEAVLSHDADVERWDRGTFRPSRYAVPELLAALNRSDFGVFCIGPDDIVRSRGTAKPAPRDNVVFEAGLFVGGLGLDRVFLIAPRGAMVKLPSDLLGTGLVEYDPGEPTVLDDAGARIRAAMAAIGPRVALRNA